MASSGPPVLVGPSLTMTRSARTAPGRRLMVEVPVGVQVPFELVGNRLRKVDAVPATPVRFTTAASAVLSLGMPPALATVTTIDFAEPTAAWPSHEAGLRVSQTRTGVIGWNRPWNWLDGAWVKYPSASTMTLTLPSALEM